MATDLLPFSEVASIVAAVSVLGIFLLFPLYMSQRSDIERLREWMLQTPEFPEEDLKLSDTRLDKAEADLEALYTTRGEPVPGTSEFRAVHPGMVAADLETSERPALTQVTMERSALEPHPKFRRFRDTVMQPRWLAAITVVAVVAAVGAIIGVDEILRTDDDSPAAPSAAEGLEVAVLNTTSSSGLAGRVAADIEAQGYVPGDVSNIDRPTDQTFVMYQPEGKRGASRIAKDLGGVPTQEIDREIEEAAGEADVVVILGEDRVGG